MTPIDQRKKLEKLLADAEADFAAAAEEDDADWPTWFAERLLEPVRALLDPSISRSRLIHTLIEAEDERLAMAPGNTRGAFLAAHLHDAFAHSADAGHDALALYYYDGCPFCTRVQRIVQQLGVTVEPRNVLRCGEHRADLIGARGRATVPVLRIQGADGSDRWMPESADIIHYLHDTYG